MITTNGTILAGFGRWRSAVVDGRHEINCIEYSLSEDEALQFIISRHQPRRGSNAFTRIRLALKLESSFQQRALDNMRAGGKYKGLANLPEARHIDVRQEIAHAAGVGARNISNVKTILKNAHSRLITALLDGALTINGAMQFSKLPWDEQLEQFIRHSEDRETGKVIRQSIGRHKEKKISPKVGAVLDVLQQREACQPGSVMVRVARFQRTVILIGQDLLTGPYFQKELDLNEISRSAPAILSRTRPHWDQDPTSPAARWAFSGVAVPDCRFRRRGLSFGERRANLLPHLQITTMFELWLSRHRPWQRERWTALPDALYKGITFTMPDLLWPLFRDDPGWPKLCLL